jgi:tripartite-type tricarboxylate transporter receptor subunit TctC
MREGAQHTGYPEHAIRLLVPYAAGGGADFWARAVSERLADRLHVAITVDNRPGTGGNAGTAIAAAGAPDGYTLLLGSVGPLAVHPATYRQLAFDPATAFAPVGLLESSPLALVIHPSVPAQTLPELLAYAKAHPGTLTCGTNGMGSPEHVAYQWLVQTAGVEIKHVPFDGAGPARKALARNGVSMMLDPMKAAMPAVQKGSERALAVAGPARLPTMPHVPTFAEAGVPGLDGLRIWTGILAPAGTPRAIIDTLNAALRDVMAEPEMRASVAQVGGRATPGSPAEFAAFIRSERGVWRTLARKTGLVGVVQ